MLLLWMVGSVVLCGAEIHVSVTGSDDGDGSPGRPLRTISAAARLAQAGDTVTVHEGTYRERVTPQRGGESDARRIVYQAASGERVVIKGSEVVRGWKEFLPGVWKVVIPNSFFGSYNPYKDLITGDWFNDKKRPHHTGEVYLNGVSLWESHLLERVIAARDVGTWFVESDDENTYLYANFLGKDPNAELVEINVRDSCFYPSEPGRNYITVRGFRMMHAATQWAAPTAEQIGLIGTHWSKGWVIENNEISDSKCACVSLGKERKTGHNVWINDPRKDGATHYNEVVLRALAIGWSRDTVGSHVVRNNVIHDCEQGGIVGSLGAVFSRIENNHIYDVWKKRQFTGAEMGGIKLHAAIDVVIQGNRIHHAGRGLWMDWMAQGTRITGNVLYANTTDDLFVEVNHGPFVVDNNLFLSEVSLRDWSEGGAYVHNLFGGTIVSQPEPRRSTPYHKAHSTAVAGLDSTTGGDDRFLNNVFVGGGLWVYNHREFPLQTGGNIYVSGARKYFAEKDGVTVEGERVVLSEDGRLRWPGFANAAARLVTGEVLGKAKVPGLGYECADGSALVLDRDFFGKKRGVVMPGPFAAAGEWKLW
ncbi:MAG: right-handed parallel beta-helix repeat-containing protein [Bryobacteraceae bacterium]